MLETLDRKVVDKVMGQERGRRKRPGAQKIRFPNNVRKAAKEYEAKYGEYGKIPYLQDHFPAKDGKRVSASTIRRCLEPDR